MSHTRARGVKRRREIVQVTFPAYAPATDSPALPTSTVIPRKALINKGGLSQLGTTLN